MAVRGFIAMSLDGFIADAGGGVDWLKPFEAVDYGYGAFISTISTVVLGRSTYDQIASFGAAWPYEGKRGIVVTSRPLSHSHPGVQSWSEGVEGLAAHLRATDQGDAWVVGGAKLQAAFIALGALDRLDLFVIPVLLGDGVPLFPKMQGQPRGLVLRSADTLGLGMVRLAYDLG
jgi:dihydrofolate reductase